MKSLRASRADSATIGHIPVGGEMTRRQAEREPYRPKPEHSSAEEEYRADPSWQRSRISARQPGGRWLLSTHASNLSVEVSTVSHATPESEPSRTRSYEAGGGGGVRPSPARPAVARTAATCGQTVDLIRAGRQARRVRRVDRERCLALGPVSLLTSTFVPTLTELPARPSATAFTKMYRHFDR
jgi:hypothetical protein